MATAVSVLILSPEHFTVSHNVIDEINKSPHNRSNLPLLATISVLIRIQQIN